MSETFEPDWAEIEKKNVETLKKLGLKGVVDILEKESCRDFATEQANHGDGVDFWVQLAIQAKEDAHEILRGNDCSVANCLLGLRGVTLASHVSEAALRGYLNLLAHCLCRFIINDDGKSAETADRVAFVQVMESICRRNWGVPRVDKEDDGWADLVG